tara:strand:- start:11895 stop:12071 length:177 start_codon:yes stop_codon:yes gene_type:complete
MFKMLSKLFANKKAMMSAMILVETIQSTTKDGKLTRPEQAKLLSAFWGLVKEIRGEDA